MLITIRFINMITHSIYVLASTSKSRYTILKNAGFNFKQVKPACDEEKLKKKLKLKKNNPSYIAKKLSYEKAKSISETKTHYNNYVIGCDTLIYMNGKIFDKAKNINEAHEKIKALSGRKHKIVSGLTVCKKGQKVWGCSSTTIVKIRKINSLQINNYLQKTGKQILMSVGCYQVESLGPQIIEDIRGDFFNVMGLPLFKLLKFISTNK